MLKLGLLVVRLRVAVRSARRGEGRFDKSQIWDALSQGRAARARCVTKSEPLIHVPSLAWPVL